MFPKEQIVAILDEESKRWLSGHTKFGLGLTVDEILALGDENARLAAELVEARDDLRKLLFAADLDAEFTTQWNGGAYVVDVQAYIELMDAVKEIGEIRPLEADGMVM